MRLFSNSDSVFPMVGKKREQALFIDRKITVLNFQAVSSIVKTVPGDTGTGWARRGTTVPGPRKSVQGGEDLWLKTGWDWKAAWSS